MAKGRQTMWHPLFTREYPLYVVDMAADAYVRLMRPAIGWGYHDALFVNRRGLITVYYSEGDAKRFYKLCQGRSALFFRQKNLLILQRAKKLQAAVQGFSAHLAPAVRFEQMHAAYQQLYGVYRFSPMVEFAAKITDAKILRDCAKTKEAAGRAIKFADRYLLSKLTAMVHRHGKVPNALALYLRAGEIRALFAGGRLPSRGELRQRHASYVHKTVGKRTVLSTGKQAAAEISRLPIVGQTAAARGEVTGKTAHPGTARGRVAVILRQVDLLKVRPGCIFVAPMTLPTQTPWVKKAAAIVTDEGGITCHAAIVARELGIPCVIGTKIATKVFKDGDMVEVNANHGVVKKLQ